MKKNILNILLQQQISQIKYEKKTIYRYMHEEEYIDMFAEGKIKVSTLDNCRKYENQEQGDSEEAKETFVVSHMTEKDPNFHKKANQLGMSFGNCSNVTITNCTSTNHLPNGFIICTTSRRDDEKFAKDFGRFCVKINDADKFFALVNNEIQKEFKLLGGDHKRVVYREQNYKDDELPPGKIGFVKRQKYTWQEEYRFLWLPHNFNQCETLYLDIPALKNLCGRIL